MPAASFSLHSIVVRYVPQFGVVNKAKVEPKTVQGLLRYSKIQTTLDLYTHEDGDEARLAQGEYLLALGVATNTIQ